MLVIKRVLPSQLYARDDAQSQPLSGAIVVETCLAPLAKFQQAWIASPAPRGRMQPPLQLPLQQGQATRALAGGTQIP